MKRFTWGCHFWLGLCLAPAGAWVTSLLMSMDGAPSPARWPAEPNPVGAHHPPNLHWRRVVDCCFDINYARMDVESDRNKAFIPSCPNLARQPPRARRSNSRSSGSPALQSPTPWTASGSLEPPLRWHWPTSSLCFEWNACRFSNGAVSCVDADRLGLTGALVSVSPLNPRAALD